MTLDGLVARTHRLAGSWWILLLEAALLLFISSVLTAALQPAPFSDWLYYWNAADNLPLYERGGAMLLLVGLLKSLGLPPYLTMLWPNQLAALTTLLIARQTDPFPGKWLSHIVAAYLILLTPYFGLVQLDLLAATMLVIGWVLALRIPATWPKLAWFLPVAAFAAAVSTRPQFLLVLVTLAAFLVVAWKIGGHRSGREIPTMLLIPLVLGAVVGFAIDFGLRAQANRSGAIRTNSAVTLYSGLLVSSAAYPGCGQWSEAATEAMRSDLGQPLPTAIIARLRGQPPEHWMAVFGCKSRQIIAPQAFAWWWLNASPNVQPRLHELLLSKTENVTRLIVTLESRLYRALTLLVYLAAGALAWSSARDRTLALLPLAWLLAFWLVHLIFEVQGRYFLATLLVTPTLCSLVLRNGGIRSSDPPNAAHQGC